MIGDIDFTDKETAITEFSFQFIGTQEERDKFVRAVMLGRGHLNANILETTESVHVENAIKANDVEVDFLYAGFSDWFDIPSEAFDEKNILLTSAYDRDSTMFDVVEGLVADFVENHQGYNRHYHYHNPSQPAPGATFWAASIRAALYLSLTDDARKEYRDKARCEWARKLDGQWFKDEVSDRWYHHDSEDGIISEVDDLPKVYVLIKTQQVQDPR